jgi:N-acyl-D-amino-acid deacylase
MERFVYLVGGFAGSRTLWRCRRAFSGLTGVNFLNTPETPDLIIRNARIVDGTGAAPVAGDIAVRDERIVAMGDLVKYSAGTEIDATGLAVSPGFIDVHTHDDRAVLVDPHMTCKVSQGVTTVVTGNCGISLAPLNIEGPPPPPLDLLSKTSDGYFQDFGDYLGALDQDPAAVNVVAQVGHSTLRAGVMDRFDRAATADEVRAMRQAMEAALEAGAAGLSTGLFYQPALDAPTEEIIELARGLKAFGAIHTTHMRDETDHIVESLEETLRIGVEADVPVVISHHKCAGAANHGRSVETLAIIDAAIRTQSLGLDAYPYVAGSTVLDATRMMGASRTIVTWSVPHPEHSGRDLDEIAGDLNMSLKEAVEYLSPAGAIYFMMDEDDVRRILAYRHTMIGSDGLPHDEHPHPRLWGTFPRVLGHYARDIGLFSLEEAVRKMTSLSASRFGLTDRGVLRVGAFADLVLFDPEKVIDTATFDKPVQAAAGVNLVFVNGRTVWQGADHTGVRPGKVLRRQ